MKANGANTDVGLDNEMTAVVGRSTPLGQKQAWMRERHAPGVPVEPETKSRFAERHYTVGEVAGMWALSADVIRRLFERETGVLNLGANCGGRRRYITLRIPESVVERVHRRMSRV